VSIFSSINTGASGLTAQRFRMDIISKNIANANTTRTANGMPYRRQSVVFKEVNGPSFSDVLSGKSKSSSNNGVEISAVKEDMTNPFKEVYDPGHPDANEKGYVLMPNVNVVTEMVNMISATRSYEANVTMINASKAMLNKALEIK
jgi:flagellar basal-body rod protein FlgC